MKKTARFAMPPTTSGVGRAKKRPLNPPKCKARNERKGVKKTEGQKQTGRRPRKIPQQPESLGDQRGKPKTGERGNAST